MRVLDGLAARGMWCLAAPEMIRDIPEVQQLYRRAPAGVIFELQSWDLLHAPLQPSALVIAPGESLPRGALHDEKPRRVILVPADVRAPGHPTMTIGDYQVSVTINDLLER